MKIIILCAGIGSRLGEYTSQKPKCLVKINSETILDRLLKQLLNLGIKNSNIFLCGGYKHDLLPSKYNKLINNNFLTTNMMSTTLVGLEELRNNYKFTDNILVIYGDCVYSDDFLSEIIFKASSFSEITLPVDLEWYKKWSERYENIYEDAETLEYDQLTNKLISIGQKTFIEKQYMAQFMGIYCIPNNLLDTFICKFNLLSDQLKKSISTTEFFQKTIGDINYFVMPDKYIWTEVDTITDLIYAKTYFI